MRLLFNNIDYICIVMIERNKDKYVVIRRPTINNKTIFKDNEYYIVKRSNIIKEIDKYLKVDKHNNVYGPMVVFNYLTRSLKARKFKDAAIKCRKLNKTNGYED